MGCRLLSRPLVPLRMLVPRCLGIMTGAASASSSFAIVPQCLQTHIDQSHLLRVCTVLFQHHNASDAVLNSRLLSVGFCLTHEFFLQVCNKFLLSWKPVYRFYKFSLEHSSFQHTAVSTNKVLDVLGKGRNVPLLWEFLCDASMRKIVDTRSYLLAAAAFAEGRQLKKCIGVFHLIERDNPELFDRRTLNWVVRVLCERKLVEETAEIVRTLRSSIPPDSATYGYLVVGFCKAGDMVQASKLWNMMLAEGMEPGVGAYVEMMVTFFKNNRLDDAMRVFKCMRGGRRDNADGNEPWSDPYRAVITWLCKQGRMHMSLMVLAEMVKSGLEIDHLTVGSLIYGLLVRRRAREAYKVYDREMANAPDISLCHGLIQGLLRLRRAQEATQVFREMPERGCEPTMHTYVTLLQGHLGKRGRKGTDPVVNFDSIFVGGLVKAGKVLEATKYAERALRGAANVPRFDYNQFLHCFSNEQGVIMFEEVGRKLRKAGMVDLADIFQMYGEKMATRDRRRSLGSSIVN